MFCLFFVFIIPVILPARSTLFSYSRRSILLSFTFLCLALFCAVRESSLICRRRKGCKLSPGLKFDSNTCYRLLFSSLHTHTNTHGQHAPYKHTQTYTTHTHTDAHLTYAGHTIHLSLLLPTNESKIGVQEKYQKGVPEALV